MVRVVINECYGAFNLTDAMVARFNELICNKPEYRAILDECADEDGKLWAVDISYPLHIFRHDENLIRAIEECGTETMLGAATYSVSRYTTLCIYNLSGDQYYINENDGYETLWEPSTMKWVVVKPKETIDFLPH